MTYRYNAGGLPIRVEGKFEGKDYAYVKRMDYDKFEQRLFVELGNGVTSTYAYDAKTRRLSQLASESSLGLFQNLQYAYDKVGNVTGLANDAKVVDSMGGPVAQSFTYDTLHRLRTADGTFKPSSEYQEKYALSMAYDDIHNIIHKTQKHEAAGSDGLLSPKGRTSYDFGYTYGSKPHAPVRIGSRTFSYDANGNQLGFTDVQNNTQRVMQWDEENRVTQLADNGRTHLYTYDDSGERIIKDADRQGITAYVSQYYTLRNATQGTKHVFVGTTRMVSKLQGGMRFLRVKSGKPVRPLPPPGSYNHPGQGIYNRSASGAEHSSNLEQNPHYADPNLPLAVTQENAHVDEPAYADWEYAFPESYEVVSVDGGGEHLFYYHPDHLGSTGYVTRTDGGLAEHIEYFPFGETWVRQGGNTEQYPYLFTSKELDEETGLYYFGARYYDPRTSVWQSVDPILGEYLPNLLDKRQKKEDWKPERDLRSGGGVYKLANMSLYAYVHHNPLIFVDPSGQDVTVKLYVGAMGFGHIGLSINNSRSTVGFYPTEEANWAETLGSAVDPVPGEWREDKRQMIDTVTIKTTPEQDKAMQDILTQMDANPGEYDLDTRNCATQAQVVLRVGGVKTPDPVTIKPRELMQFLKDEYSHRSDGLH